MAFTDFSTISIRDGLHGGVWRALWQGITGQISPVKLEIFGTTHYGKTVQFTGITLLWQLFSGALAGNFVFDILWTLLSVALQTGLGVGAALLLHQPALRFRAFWRTIFILPWAIPEFVGALLWLRIFEPRFGLLALAAELPADIITPPWYANPTYTFIILLIAATWYGFPFIMLSATASLKFLPIEVYEAAAIDGATLWAQFRWITWPLLMPLLVPAIIIRAIFAFNQFYLFYTLQIPPPLLTFSTISYFFFYPNSNFGGQFAISAAINMFTVFILILMLYWFNRWSHAAEGVTE
jgi:arabinogalactan oligomer/maltooligosaccharide transport system permease protein